MAKCLFCRECSAIRSFPVDGSTAECECPPDKGKVVGWWVDIDSALVQMAVLPPGSRDKVRVLLLQNFFLRAETMPTGYATPDGQIHPFDQQQVDANWRKLHDDMTTLGPRLPEALTVFHVSRRGCPLVVQYPGMTPDTHWATDVELRQRGLLEAVAVG